MRDGTLPDVATEPERDRKVTSDDVQFYFKAVRARARVHLNSARHAAAMFAKRNGGERARLVELRIQYLALDEARQRIAEELADAS